MYTFLGVFFTSVFAVYYNLSYLFDCIGEGNVRSTYTNKEEDVKSKERKKTELLDLQACKMKFEA